ncbi:hypothetical protein ACMYYO_12270 [Dermacoccaceae bacterium W4C1]
MNPSSRAGTHRLPRRAVAVVVVFALAVIAGGFWWTQRGSDAVRSIETINVTGRPSMLGADRTVAFSLPGMSQLTVKVRVGHQGRDYASDREFTAADGERLVGISWETPRMRQVGEQETVTPHPITVQVSTGDDTRTVATITPAVGTSAGRGDADDSVLLRVPGEAQDLRVIARWQGREQSVAALTGQRTPGAFGWLYRPQAAAASRTSGRDSADDPSDITWSVSMYRTVERAGYVNGIGWAPAGKEWVVVRDGMAIMGDPTFRDGDGERRAYYEATRRAAQVTVDGKAPTRNVTNSRRQRVTSGVIYSPGSQAFVVADGAGFTLRTTIAMDFTRSGGDVGPASARADYDVSTVFAPVMQVGAAR